MFIVQSVVEAIRWTLGDIPPMQLSGAFGNNGADDPVTLATLALAAIPLIVLLGLAARSRCAMSPPLAAAMLFLSTLLGSVLYGVNDGTVYPAASILWLPLLLVPVALTVLATRARGQDLPVAGRGDANG